MYVMYISCKEKTFQNVKRRIRFRVALKSMETRKAESPIWGISFTFNSV